MATIPITIQDRIRHKRFHADLPTDREVEYLIDDMVYWFGLPRCDVFGRPITYDLVRAWNNKQMNPEHTLEHIGVREGERLMLKSAMARLLWPWIEKLLKQIEDAAFDQLWDRASDVLSRLEHLGIRSRQVDSLRECIPPDLIQGPAKAGVKLLLEAALSTPATAVVAVVVVVGAVAVVGGVAVAAPALIAAPVPPTPTPAPPATVVIIVPGDTVTPTVEPSITPSITPWPSDTPTFTPSITSTWTATPDVTPPDPPRTILPTGTVTIPNCKGFVDLAWEQASDPSGIQGYEVTWETQASDGSWKVDSSTTSTTSLSIEPTCTYTELVNYRWRVRAIDGMGNKSEWSPGADSYTSFGVFWPDTTPPSVPVPVSPLTETDLVCPGAVQLRWWAATDDSSKVSYYFEVEVLSKTGWANYMGPYPAEGEEVDFAVLAPNCGRQMRWHVRTVDKAGNNSDWSPFQIFNMWTRISPVGG